MCLRFEEQSTDDEEESGYNDDSEDDDDANERIGPRCNRVYRWRRRRLRMNRWRRIVGVLHHDVMRIAFFGCMYNHQHYTSDYFSVLMGIVCGGRS